MKYLGRYLAVALAASVVLGVGIGIGFKHDAIIARFKAVNPWDDTTSRSWNKSFQMVVTGDGGQKAYFLKSTAEKPMPLVVSLHTWSGDFSQTDPLAAKVAQMGWNYIHPDSRGRNNKPDACLSDQVISDIDEAIEYARNNSAVDADQVYVVGVSGGAYTSLGYYLKGRQKVKSVISWVPISDLESWYWQSRRRSLGYADDIAACTGSNGELNVSEARKRSPLNWGIDKSSLPGLSIYAGINDGYTGSVPISHSINFFNKIALHFGATDKDLIDRDQTALLLARGAEKLQSPERIEDREVIYSIGFANASLTIFDGGHELLVDHTAKELLRLYRD